MDLKDFWDECLVQIKNEIEPSDFDFWFSGITISSPDNQQLLLDVPSAFFRDQLKKKYFSLIESKMSTLIGKKIPVEFQINEESSPPVPARTSQNTAPSKSEPKVEIKKDEVRAKRMATGLSPDYSFETFVVGENLLPFNAATAISKEPGKDYNPFLIYGGVGLGKTHLMQAIGNAISHKHDKFKIQYMTSEDFMNDFYKHLDNNSMAAFKTKYRNMDLLLLDDIHDLQTAVKTQEELFHTFNALYENKKQMVFTSDRPPTEIKNFTERLKSRFERGLVVDLQLPSWETRLAILRKKCELKGVTIKNDILEMIAKNITTNVRDLEAALTKLYAWADLVGKELTLDVAKEQLKAIFSAPAQSNISIDLIQKNVASFYNLTTVDLKNKKKTQSISLPRQVAMWICRDITEYSLIEIGTEFGGRDHSTVLHAVEKINNLIKTDPSMEPTLQNLTRSIKESVIKG